MTLGLQEYGRKRDFGRTPEPPAKPKNRKSSTLHFVIQKHAANRLHYDFRLETREGVLKSWAVPKGISLDPAVKRLAIMTEDHPGDYIDFEGEIPKGSYGAGRVIVWDTGRYETKDDLEGQIRAGKIKFTLQGMKARGSFSLVKLKDSNQWLLTKHQDEYASTKDLIEMMPGSVLSGRTIESMPDPKQDEPRNKGDPKDFPSSVRPMLAMPVDEPFDRDDWVFEVKWDGVRALLFLDRSRGILQLRSRKGGDITRRYPEIARLADSVKCNNSAVLDGEIVVLSKEGVPDFQRHQKRMHVDNQREIEFLSRDSPATYYVFDILYLDGLSFEGLDFVTRREMLSRIIPGKSRIRISDFVEREGRAFYKNAIAMKLEGVVAKYKYGKYLQGTRSATWLKIKGALTQDCAVVGYTSGEGNREGYFGSLILAANRGGKLQFVGHTGSGFGFDQLEQTLKTMQRLVVERCPIDHVPYVNRKPVWLRPELVAEVKFNSWTQEGIMRAPIFVRFRDDKKPEECVIETPKETDAVITQVKPPDKQRVSEPAFSNLDKVFWNATSNHKALTKKDLIDYYDSVSSYILPHLRDRPLSLSRYPDGIAGKSFYHKNWSQSKPEYAKTIHVFSESSERIINYLMCNNRETLLWLANLGCIEMHPWYSRVRDFSACTQLAAEPGEEQSLQEAKCGLETPDFIIFDLDPYIYSGKEAKGHEPEYNTKGFRATVEVAYELKDLFDSLKIKSYVKTSGKTGLHVFVPVAPLYTYDQTRSFAELAGKILSRKTKNKITMEWNVSKRKGKVFFDHNQNAKGKTVASVFSARPTRSATVSMPVQWKNLDKILPTDFTTLNVPGMLKKSGDPWKDILRAGQDLDSILENVP